MPCNGMRPSCWNLKIAWRNFILCFISIDGEDIFTTYIICTDDPHIKLLCFPGYTLTHLHRCHVILLFCCWWSSCSNISDDRVNSLSTSDRWYVFEQSSHQSLVPTEVNEELFGLLLKATESFYLISWSWTDFSLRKHPIFGYFLIENGEKCWKNHGIAERVYCDILRLDENYFLVSIFFSNRKSANIFVGWDCFGR